MPPEAQALPKRFFKVRGKKEELKEDKTKQNKQTNDRKTMTETKNKERKKKDRPELRCVTEGNRTEAGMETTSTEPQWPSPGLWDRWGVGHSSEKLLSLQWLPECWKHLKW